MPDKTLTCRDCGTNFTFTTGEQDFFASKGFTNEPGRCLNCRSANKEARNTSSSGGGYGGGYGAGNGGGAGYERRQQQMFSAVCGQCGKEAQVPFQPRGDRPVYCSTCFEGQRERSGTQRGGDRY